MWLRVVLCVCVACGTVCGVARGVVRGALCALIERGAAEAEARGARILRGHRGPVGDRHQTGQMSMPIL